MAKETNNTKKKGGEAVVSTEENVMDMIRKGNLIDEEVIKLGDEKDDQEQKERLVREYRNAKNKAKYQNLKALLQLRARRREEKATKEWLTATKGLFDDLCAGNKTPREYEEARTEAAKERDKAMNESAKQLRKEIEELKDQFPGYWRWDWED